MVVSLRVILDQLTHVADPDVAEAEREIARALVESAPKGCAVEGIVPAGDEDAVGTAVPGLAGVTKAGLTRGRLAAAWQIGVTAGVTGGLIHAPSPLAPLVRHDRVNESDQIVVTLWDLAAWEQPDTLPRSVVAGQRALLRRAEKHADAVIVPTHAMADRLSEMSKLAGRVRVIAGAAPAGFAVPSDAVGRRRSLRVPEGAVVLSAAACDNDALAAGFSAVASIGHSTPVVLIGAADSQAECVRELAAAAGIAGSDVHVLGALDAPDRAAVLDSAAALLAPSGATGFPWRVVEALALGIPVVATASAVHREVLVDGGLYVAVGDLGDALRRVIDSEESRRRFSVRALDRGKAFSWRDHAERVWALHAEL
jgi:glycosyltransferase involved in cell wall biosynthesis